MDQDEVTLDGWTDLHTAAVALKELGPWDWVEEDDLFGVQNPETGEIGYCCIMGSLGEHLALGVYLGTEGLAGYWLLRELADKLPPHELVHLQKCLMVSFEDRSLLTVRDLEVIKKVGLKFRGRHAWPKFQRFDPGYYPWYLNEPDVRFLTLAIEQAIDVCKRLRKHPQLVFNVREEEEYLVRRSTKHKGKLSWRDEWMPPQPVQAVFEMPQQIDASRLQKIQQRVKRHEGFVEMDNFYLPSPVQDHPSMRPYFPVIHLFVDSDSGMILHSQIEQETPTPNVMVETLAHFLEKQKTLPKMLLVQSEMLYRVLKELTKALGIELIFVQSLTMLEQARESLFEFWMGRK